MTDQLQKAGAPDLSKWRVAKKIRPGERGALKLARQHGDQLLCVRYRENQDATERITTIELVIDRAIIQKRADPVVAFKIRRDEVELRRLAQAKGAKYDPIHFMWKLHRSEVLRLGLGHRIAVTEEQMLQEHVRP